MLARWACAVLETAARGTPAARVWAQAEARTRERAPRRPAGERTPGGDARRGTRRPLERAEEDGDLFNHISRGIRFRTRGVMARD
jgi:hypothetical protein